jgi:hypothetical protein
MTMYQLQGVVLHVESCTLHIFGSFVITEKRFILQNACKRNIIGIYLTADTLKCRSVT